MLRTRFTELVGCAAPIQSAGMGAISTPELAAAVADAGGLGMIGLAGAPPDAVAKTLDGLARERDGAIGINFLVPMASAEPVEAASSRCRVVEFFWGDPRGDLVRAGHEGGAVVAWQVGSREDAESAAGLGCDFVIVQGTEAGGHQHGSTALLPLLDEVLDAVDVPVLASGGIGSARGVAAMLAAGADGVRLGTRFVATFESGAHPEYMKAIVDARASDAVRSSAFSVGCPLCPSTHGVLSSCVHAAEQLDDANAGSFRGNAVPRFAGMPPYRDAEGRIEAMAMYAGQSVGAIHAVQPAGEVVRELVEGAERLLRRWS